jgi:hypothetical protein
MNEFKYAVKRALIAAAIVALGGCGTAPVRCDGRLRPINVISSSQSHAAAAPALAGAVP